MTDYSVINVRAGIAPTIIICDAVIGDIVIRGVTLRRGRGMATYVNLPKQYHGGHWMPAVEINSADLLDAIRHAVVMAGLEATRFGATGYAR